MDDQIKSQLDMLGDLSDEQVSQLHDGIISSFETVETQDPTPETVDAMTSLADALDTVRGELSRREAMAEELAAAAAEATARVKGTEDVANDGEAMSENSDNMPMEGEGPAEAETPDETIAEGGKEEEMPAAPADVAPTDEPAVPADDNTPAETPGQVEEGTADEEAKETPVEEEEEKKTEESTYSAETETASTIEVDGSELSTENNEETATVAEFSAEAPAEATTQENISAPSEQEVQATVTASAEESFSAPADRQPVVQVSEAAPVAITAGADIPGYTAGSTIKDMNEVAVAMEKRIHSLRRVNGGDGEQHIVASIATPYAEERTLTSDAEANSAKIAAFAAESQALVASGGHAAPYQVKYDIFAIGSTTVRPVRDALPAFQADRGGIRFVTPPSFAAGTYDSAVGVWTAAVDAAWTGTSPNNQTKTSYTVTAAQEQTKATDAVTLQLQFGNLMTRAYPELIARHNELALVQHAREAEDNILAGIEAGSTAVTTTNLIGFGRDFLVQVRRASTAYRSRHRISLDTRLKVIIPAWVYDAMAADLTLAMPGDGTLSVSKSEIEGYLSQLNVDLVTTVDGTGSGYNGVFGAQSAGALLEFPDSFKWFIFAEGTFLFLDGGTLDLGIIRDSTLVGTNDYKMFVESFEAVAKVGIESLCVTSTINVNGVAAALRDTTGGTAAATIEL